MVGPDAEEERVGAIHLREAFLGMTRHKVSRYAADTVIDAGGLAE